MSIGVHGLETTFQNFKNVNNSLLEFLLGAKCIHTLLRKMTGIKSDIYNTTV